MESREYHTPVMLEESLDALNISPNGVYLDATFGSGGHSKAILEKLGSKGRLYVFDQDEDAIANIEHDARMIFIKSNFRHVKNFMQYYEVTALNGVLMDLGVSSHQFDSDDRGFAHRFDQELDMRMSVGMDLSAKRILDEYSQEDLTKVFSEYGEVRNSKSLARAIIEMRDGDNFIGDTRSLNALLERFSFGNPAKYFAQVYQALRIEVNDEIGALEDFLEDIVDLMAEKGRLAVMSYHSIEDRLAKVFLKTGRVDGVVEKDAFGKIYRPFKVLTKRPIVATEEEIKRNSRARSAKLRVAQRI